MNNTKAESKCECGGLISNLSVTNERKEIYQDLYKCIDCNSKYWLKDNQYKYISNAEYRRIIHSREVRLGYITI